MTATSQVHYTVNAELTHLDHVGQRPPVGTRVIRVALSSDTSHIITCAPDVVLDYRATAAGIAELPADVLGAAHAGAFLAAVGAWARTPVGRTPFAEVMTDALAAAERRASVAEAIATERERIISAQSRALRLLEAGPSDPATPEPSAPVEPSAAPPRRWWRRRTR